MENQTAVPADAKRSPTKEASIMIRILTAFCFSILFAAVAASETATLKMRLVYDGGAPPQNPIIVNPAFGPLIDERLLVDAKSKGIKNVLVSLYTGRRGTKIDLPPIENEKRRLTMANSRFDPHILIAHAGDTLELVNRGPNQHSLHVNFFENAPQVIVLPPGKLHLVPVPRPEPAPMSIGCNIHPWMNACIVVLDHPFAALSDTDGNLAIAGLPVGTFLVFRVFHEAGQVDRVKMSGVDTEWPRSLFKVELAPGVNDLGDILIPSESLK